MTDRLHYVARSLSKLQKCLYCYLAPTQDHGIGVFAARDFNHGEIVMMDCDGDLFEDVLTLEELFECEIFDYPLQIGNNMFRVPTGSIEDFTNHSCDPNTGIRQVDQGLLVIALRRISANEEITFDYSTWLSIPSLQFECRCGSDNCRGIVRPFDHLPDHLREYYISLNVVGDFILEGLTHCETCCVKPPSYNEADS